MPAERRARSSAASRPPGLAPPALTARHGRRRVALVENAGGVGVLVAVRRVRAGWNAVVDTTQHVRAIAFSIMARCIGACCSESTCVSESTPTDERRSDCKLPDDVAYDRAHECSCATDLNAAREGHAHERGHARRQAVATPTLACGFCVPRPDCTIVI